MTFDAVTAAYGLTTTISNPSIPAGLTIEGDSTVSTGHVSSLGYSDGVAAFPYPGDSVAGLPGTGAGIVDGLLPSFGIPIKNIPVPAYPAQVKSAYGSRAPQQVDYPGVTLASHSDQRKTESRAVVGTDSNGISSSSTVQQDDDGTVTATSTASMNGLQIGPEATLSGVTATVTAKLSSTGKFSSTSSFSIGKINVPGLQLSVPTIFPAPLGGSVLQDPALGFTDGAFTVTSPLDGTVMKLPIPVDTVFAAFKTAGYNVSFEAPTTTANSIVGGTFRLQTVLPAPPANKLYQGPTNYTFAFGQTSASIDGQAIPQTADTSGFTGNQNVNPPPSTGTATTPVDNGSGTGTTDTSGLGSTGSSLTPPDLGGTSSLASGGSAPVVAGQAPGVASGNGQQLVALGLQRSKSPVFWLYLVVIGVGIIGTFSSGVLRYGGIRSAWRS